MLTEDPDVQIQIFEGKTMLVDGYKLGLAEFPGYLLGCEGVDHFKLMLRRLAFDHLFNNAGQTQHVLIIQLREEGSRLVIKQTRSPLTGLFDTETMECDLKICTNGGYKNESFIIRTNPQIHDLYREEGYIPIIDIIIGAVSYDWRNRR